jgi:hypothetical protein
MEFCKQLINYEMYSLPTKSECKDKCLACFPSFPLRPVWEAEIYFDLTYVIRDAINKVTTLIAMMIMNTGLKDGMELCKHYFVGYKIL